MAKTHCCRKIAQYIITYNKIIAKSKIDSIIKTNKLDFNILLRVKVDMISM